MNYDLQATNRFKRSAKKLSIKSLNKIEKKINNLSKKPREGKPLKKDLKGIWSLHVIHKKTHYRVIYTINKKKKMVVLHYVGTRENIYKSVRRLKI